MSARMLLFLLAGVSLSAAAQESMPVPAQDTGYLYVSHDHVQWPAPEVLVKDLASRDDKVRLQALRLLGFAEQETHIGIWTQTLPSKVIGEAVITPDQIESNTLLWAKTPPKRPSLRFEPLKNS